MSGDEFPPENFANRAFRQGVDELDDLWRLVGRDPFANAETDVFGKFVGPFHPVAQNADGANTIANLLVRKRHDAGFDNRGVLAQNVFDLVGRDKNTPALEAIVISASDAEIALLVAGCEIPRVVPAVME